MKYNLVSTYQASVNILNLYNQATIGELQAGMAWYYLANNSARQLQQVYDFTMPQICGVIAALSPRNKWYRNLQDCSNLLSCIRGESNIEDYKCGTFTSNKIKARLILATPNTTHEQVLSILGGNKVRSFYSNILEPSNPNYLTVDGHALGCYQGVKLRGCTPSNKDYQTITDTYSHLAIDKIGILPNQLQAINWLTYKRLHNC